MTKEQLEKINKFTRRPLAEEEVYTFSVILCDNDIDRDGECFSDTALAELKELFVGKTGIFDHNPKSLMQSARIYDTELVTDSSRRSANGEEYKYLKACAYMVKTDENRSLIAEIDGGIKKEVSVSCSASQRICSVCGCDKSKAACNHIKGRSYSGKTCYTVLSGITDAYEWSFVAVPAQVNAGVTKRFVNEEDIRSEKLYADIEAAEGELRRDIRRLAFIVGGKSAADTAAFLSRTMNTAQLIDMKKSYETTISTKNNSLTVQLSPESSHTDSTDGFSMR